MRYTVSAGIRSGGEDGLECVLRAMSGKHFDDEVGFNAFCRSALRAWESVPGHGDFSAPDFPAYLARASADCPLPWGGVWNLSRNGDRVEKYLVIRQGCYLPLERHAEKLERIKVCQGAGILLWGRDVARPGALEATLILPGAEFVFMPGAEHCLMGGSSLVVFEQSVDPLGEKDITMVFNGMSAMR